MRLRTRTHPALKWLKGKRARLAGVHSRIEEKVDEIAVRIGALQARVEKLRRRQDEYLAGMADLDEELSAMDATIKGCGLMPDPAQIAKIKEWAGRYGKRGDLKNAILQIIRERSPGAISTTELYGLLVKRFCLKHTTYAERQRWRTSTLGKRLSEMRQAGVIERVSGPMLSGHVALYWRWKEESFPSMAELRQEDERDREDLTDPANQGDANGAADA